MTDESSQPSDTDEDETRDRDPREDAPEDASPTGDRHDDQPDDEDATNSGQPDDEDATDSGQPDGEDATNSGQPDGEDATDPGQPDDGGFAFGENTVEPTADSESTNDQELTDDSQHDDDSQRDRDRQRDDETAASDGVLAAAGDRLPYPETSRSVLGALLAMSVASLVLRFVSLGARVAHQDEGRVGYWIIRYLESGAWEYRAIVHGPFLFHVNKWVFEFLGPSDVTMRLAVAVIGGLLPLTAWLFRKHLRDTEVLALGFLLALNPVLVYYSRFMRNDVPLAAFMLLALGCAVRYYDTRNYRYVYGAVGAFALGMTTKENGLLYAACWLGAAVLLLDHRLFVSRLVDDARGPFRTALAYLHWLAPVTIRRVPTVLEGFVGQTPADTDTDGRSGWWIGANWTGIVVAITAVLQFFAIIVFFYAPRGGAYLKAKKNPPSHHEDTTDAMGLYSSIDELVAGDAGQFLLVVEEATVGSWEEFTRVWGGHEHSYVEFASHYIEVMLAGALVVSLFAILGLVVDRYGSGGPRDLVALSAYWGFVSVLGYPIATDIRAGWATSHAIVPLAIPAAVGLAILLRWAMESYTLEDAVGLGIAVLLLLSVVGQMGYVVTTDVYQNPQSPDNELVQYAQPSTDVKPTLERVEQLGLEHGGPGDVDVLFWGQKVAVANETELRQPPAAGGYYGRRTWMWYMEMYQYNANQSGEHFEYEDTESGEYLNDTRPPVVITFSQNQGPRLPKDGGETLHEWLLANGYEQVSHQRYGGDPDAEVSRPILFYLRVNPNEATTDGPFQGTGDNPWRTSAFEGWEATTNASHPGGVDWNATTDDAGTSDHASAASDGTATSGHFSVTMVSPTTSQVAARSNIDVDVPPSLYERWTAARDSNAWIAVTDGCARAV